MKRLIENFIIGLIILIINLTTIGYIHWMITETIKIKIVIAILGSIFMLPITIAMNIGVGYCINKSCK